MQNYINSLLRRPLCIAALALAAVVVLPACSQNTCPAYGGQGDKANLFKKRSESGLWDKRMKNPYSSRR